jgi:hypothetical protein
MIVVGAVFAAHCFRAGRKELRSGLAEGGRFGSYHRGERGFWRIIVLTFGSSAFGVLFVIFGIALAVASL